MILSDLATPQGIRTLIAQTGGPQGFYGHPTRHEGIATIVQDTLKRKPNLANVRVEIVPNMANALYNFDTRTIHLGCVEPIGLAHEIGHATNIQQEGLYRKVLRAAQGVSRLNFYAALPTALALRSFIHDPEKRNDILDTLSALSIAAAAPTLLEEANASINALQHAPDKARAMRVLGPAFLAHFTSNMTPVVAYQAGKL